MSKSKIEWTDKTWNPVRGCSRVSPGCLHCYAETMAARFCGPTEPFHLFAERKPHPHWTGQVSLIDDRLLDPLKWRKPQRIFVNSMSDLFHEDLPVRDIDRIGGESGRNARPCSTRWIQDVLRFGEDSRIPVFVKQLGSKPALMCISDPKGGNMSEWPPDLRVRQFPVRP